MSDTNQFIPVLLELCLQILPVIACLGIVVLLVDGTDLHQARRSTIGLSLRPIGTHFPVVIKPNRYLVHLLVTVV